MPFAKLRYRSFQKAFSTFVLTFRENGEINHTILRFSLFCFCSIFTSWSSNSCVGLYWREVLSYSIKIYNFFVKSYILDIYLCLIKCKEYTLLQLAIFGLSFTVGWLAFLLIYRGLSWDFLHSPKMFLNFYVWNYGNVKSIILF